MFMIHQFTLAITELYIRGIEINRAFLNSNSVMSFSDRAFMAIRHTYAELLLGFGSSTSSLRFLDTYYPEKVQPYP